MKFDGWCLTDIGLRRESNQDTFLLNKESGLFLVADGMGGHSGGEVASSMAVEIAAECMEKGEFKSNSPRDKIRVCYEEASRRIFDFAAHEKPELLGMGTTLVFAHFVNNKIYVGNVGDSRCYLFTQSKLWQITEDHSLVNEQLRSGIMNEQQVKQHVARNVITRSVGFERDVVPDIIEREVHPGEIYLICSDGLTGMVSDDEICDILRQNTPDKAVKDCVKLALDNGGNDNVTVMLIHFYE